MVRRSRIMSDAARTETMPDLSDDAAKQERSENQTLLTFRRYPARSEGRAEKCGEQRSAKVGCREQSDREMRGERSARYLAAMVAEAQPQASSERDPKGPSKAKPASRAKDRSDPRRACAMSERRNGRRW